MIGDRHTQAVLAAAALSCLLLAGCGGKGEAPAPPETYALGGNSVAALTLEEGAALAEATTSGEGEEQVDVYDYTGLSAPGEAAGAYTRQLTADGGFTLVDEAGKETDAPDFTTGTGSVRLAQAAAEEGRLFSLTLEWDPEGCTVTVASPAGQIEAKKGEGLTAREAAEYMASLPPDILGLPGSSMDQYDIIVIPGAVLVDGSGCMQLNVYNNQNPEATNEILGSYLLSGDQSHLYRLEGDGVTELSL